MGDIGIAVAERARCFEMKMLYTKRRRLGDDEERRLGIEYTSLEDLLKKSDFISLHVPHTQETEKMIGKKELTMMKPSAYLINVSRGGIIDEKALCEALKSGVIAGAGLDVFEKEPLAKDSPLLKLDNVTLTPHNAANYPDGLHIVYDVRRASENIFSVAQGGKPLHGSLIV
jgi:phosphoglycerate dehydrogenase-like enzyme